MRQVFSSLRLENVEGVAKLLEDAGIEVRITGGRSYKGGWSGRRTYNDSARGEQAAVWVIRSEDQPRARQLLRDAGLLESTTRSSDTYLGPSLHQRAEDAAPPSRQRRALRAKIWLLAGIAIVVVLVFNAVRRQGGAPTAPPAVPTTTAPAGESLAPPPLIQPITGPTPRHTIETPPALAATLLAAELRAQRVREACVSVDGAPLPAAEFAALEQPSIVLHNPDACAGEQGIPLAFDVRAWTTDGSGTGTVELATIRRDAGGEATAEVRELTVAREGTQWRVLDPGSSR
jgi:hypothetical protein